MSFLKRFGDPNWWFGDESLYAQFQPDQGTIVVPGGSYSWGDTPKTGDTIVEGVDSDTMMNYGLIAFGGLLLYKMVAK